MKNSILKYDYREINDMNVQDYTSFDVTQINDFIIEFTELGYFDWYKTDDDDKLERISYELYGTSEYWDLLLLINWRNPLIDMSYNFDVISDIADSIVQDYSAQYSNGELPEQHAEQLKSMYENKLTQRNEELRALRIVIPNKLYDFMRIAYERGIFE